MRKIGHAIQRQIIQIPVLVKKLEIVGRREI